MPETRSNRQTVPSRAGESAEGFAEFLREETTGGRFLLIATAVALVWANVAGDSYRSVWEAGRRWALAGCIST